MNIGPDFFEIQEKENKRVVKINPPREAFGRFGNFFPGLLPRIKIEVPEEMRLRPEYVEGSVGPPSLTLGFVREEEKE